MNFKQDPDSILLSEYLCTSFEQKHSIKLPEDYKHFLTNIVNGGEVSCSNPVINIPNGGKTLLTIFLGIGAKGSFNMENDIWMLGEERLPQGMIPIADDPGGNYFFMQTIGENTGNIYFFDHEVEPNEPPTIDDNPSMTLVTTSFTEFLNSIECIEN